MAFFNIAKRRASLSGAKRTRWIPSADQHSRREVRAQILHGKIWGRITFGICDRAAIAFAGRSVDEQTAEVGVEESPVRIELPADCVKPFPVRI